MQNKKKTFQLSLIFKIFAPMVAFTVSLDKNIFLPISFCQRTGRHILLQKCLTLLNSPNGQKSHRLPRLHAPLVGLVHLSVGRVRSCTSCAAVSSSFSQFSPFFRLPSSSSTLGCLMPPFLDRECTLSSPSCLRGAGSFYLRRCLFIFCSSSFVLALFSLGRHSPSLCWYLMTLKIDSKSRQNSEIKTGKS